MDRANDRQLSERVNEAILKAYRCLLFHLTKILCARHNMNLLFVCSENRLRSPTAEIVFGEYPNVEAISAGTNKDAETPVTGDLIEWADAILVMEKSHRHKIAQKFKKQLKGKKLAVLDIPDKYEYMDPELVKLLRSRVPKYVHI